MLNLQMFLGQFPHCETRDKSTQCLRTDMVPSQWTEIHPSTTTFFVSLINDFLNIRRYKWVSCSLPRIVDFHAVINIILAWVPLCDDSVVINVIVSWISKLAFYTSDTPNTPELYNCTAVQVYTTVHLYTRTSENRTSKTNTITNF